MSLRPMGVVDAVNPNMPRACASAMSLAATVLESTTATRVSTICADPTAAPATDRSHTANATARGLERGPRRAAEGSEGLANREIDLDPGVVLDLAERIAHVEADRADRRGDPEAAADARVEVGEGEVLDLGRDGACVEEGNAAQPAVDREAPLEVEQELEITALRIAAGIQWSDLVELVAANGRAATGLEPVLDHEGVGAAIGRRQAEAARDRQHSRRGPRDEERIFEPELDKVHVAPPPRGADLERGVVKAPPPWIGRLVAELERQRGHDAGDEVVAVLDAAGLQETLFDVVAAEVLEAVAEAAAQVLGMVRGLVGTEERPQGVAAHREGRTQSVADVADLVLPFAERDPLPLPFRAEDPGLSVLELGAIALLAHPLTQGNAPPGAEQVVVADRHEPSKAL